MLHLVIVLLLIEIAPLPRQGRDGIAVVLRDELQHFDVRGGFEAGIGQAILTVPFLLFVVIGLLRQSSEGTRPVKKTNPE